MKDTLNNKSFYLQSLVQTSESINKDLEGIHAEIIEYNRIQRQEKSSVSSDTIYTVKVTLFIFIIGIIIDRILKKVDRILKEADLKKFFVFHLEQANINLITKLKEVYQKFHDETNIDTGLPSTAPKVISSDFQRLLNINHEDLFKAYKNKITLSKVVGQIEFTQEVQNAVASFHERVLIDSDEIRNDLAIQADEYLGVLNKFILFEKQNNIDYKSSQTYNMVNRLVMKYYQELSGTRQLQVFYTDIIRVIQENIVNSGEYKTHVILMDVAERGRKLSQIVSHLTHKTKEITTQYQVFADYMNGVNIKLNLLLTELK